MININLLPTHLRPIKRSPIPYLISIAISALLLAAVGAIFVQVTATKYSKLAELTALQEEYKKYESVVNESKKIAADEQKIKDKIATIVEIVSDRIIWSRQLWNLSRLAPPNLWYSGFAEDSKEIKETIEEMDPKTKKMVKKDITKRRALLRVSGYVITTPELQADVNPFLISTEQDKEFSKLFSLQTPSFKDTLFEDRPVKSFTLEFEIKPEGKGQ